MADHKALVRKFFSRRLARYRKKHRLTQESMAEHLQISGRAYGDLERGRYCFSAITLMLFLAMLSEEEQLETIRTFSEEITRLEQGE